MDCRSSEGRVGLRCVKPMNNKENDNVKKMTIKKLIIDIDKEE